MSISIEPSEREIYPKSKNFWYFLSIPILRSFISSKLLKLEIWNRDKMLSPFLEHISLGFKSDRPCVLRNDRPLDLNWSKNQPFSVISSWIRSICSPFLFDKHDKFYHIVIESIGFEKTLIYYSNITHFWGTQK